MSYNVESVEPGQLGIERQRLDARVAEYIQEKRPAPTDPHLYNYRTAACLACHQARPDGADPALLAFLEGEHAWAVGELMKLDPESLAELGYDVPPGVIKPRPVQGDLFADIAA